MTTKSLRNADLGRLTATTRRRTSTPASGAGEREQRLRTALATARQEAASARTAARICAEALVQAEQSHGTPGAATRTLLAAAQEADDKRATQQTSKDARNKLQRRQKELREELAHAKAETASLQQQTKEALRRDRLQRDQAGAADASFAAVSNRVAQLDRENARCVSQAKRALASAGEVARRMARAEAAVQEHQARADRAEAEAAELRARKPSGDGDRQLREASRRAEQASARASSATQRAEGAEMRAKGLEDRVSAAERKAVAAREAELAADARAEEANEAEATACAQLDDLRSASERGQASLMAEVDELRAARERVEGDAASAVQSTNGAVEKLRAELAELKKAKVQADERARAAELAASAADARAAVAAESRVVRVASAQPSVMTPPATRGGEALRWRARAALDAAGVGVSLKDGDGLVLAAARGEAYDAGLRASDVVLEVGGAVATTARAAASTVATARDNGAATVEFVVERRGAGPDVQGLENALVDAKTRLAQAVLENGGADTSALERELVDAKTRLAQLALESASGDASSSPSEREKSLVEELAKAKRALETTDASPSDRENALQDELAKTKAALETAVHAARTLGEQHDESLKREASHEDLSSDEVSRSEALVRELADAKLKLAQMAMELGELKMGRSQTPPPAASSPENPARTPRRSWLNRKSK